MIHNEGGAREMNELPFDPYPFIEDPHRQTILGGMITIFPEPVSEEMRVRLQDGDQISLQVTTPKGWKEDGLTVLMLHGVCGSHRSPYLVRLATKVEASGARAVRMNMRGWGSGRGLSRGMLHSGKSEDIFQVIQAIKKKNPKSSIILIGFSLGAAMTLKLAGELGSLGSHFLEKVIAVSPPIDLYSSIFMLGQEENAIYENYFYKHLREEILFRHTTFKELPPIHLPKKLKLYELDQVYTAPNGGFSSAVDYYEKCSAMSYVPEIRLPCKILLSEDDPIISPHSFDGLCLRENMQLFKTKKGGHMGYLGKSEGKNGIYWLDQVMLDWIWES